MHDSLNPEIWLQDYGDILFRYAHMRLHDEHLAEDMVQETLLTAWKNRERFKASSSLQAWLIDILKHKVVDTIRLGVRQQKLGSELETDLTSQFFSSDGAWLDHPKAWLDHPELCCDDLRFRLILKQCLAALPSQQQGVFEMRELSGDDKETICKAFDLTPMHFHVVMYRARLSLQRCLQKYWFGGR